MAARRKGRSFPSRVLGRAEAERQIRGIMRGFRGQSVPARFRGLTSKERAFSILTARLQRQGRRPRSSHNSGHKSGHGGGDMAIGIIRGTRSTGNILQIRRRRSITPGGPIPRQKLPKVRGMNVSMVRTRMVGRRRRRRRSRM